MFSNGLFRAQWLLYVPPASTLIPQSAHRVHQGDTRVSKYEQLLFAQEISRLTFIMEIHFVFDEVGL